MLPPPDPVVNRDRWPRVGVVESAMSKPTARQGPTTIIAAGGNHRRVLGRNRCASTALWKRMVP